MGKSKSQLKREEALKNEDANVEPVDGETEAEVLADFNEVDETIADNPNVKNPCGVCGGSGLKHQGKVCDTCGGDGIND